VAAPGRLARAALAAGLLAGCASEPRAPGDAALAAPADAGEAAARPAPEAGSDPAAAPPCTPAEACRIVQIEAGSLHTCARRASGQVLCWGSNASGEIGDGTRGLQESPRRVPVPVFGVADAVDLAAGHEHTCALRSGGEIVCWGKNEYGQLGDGTAGLPQAAPVKVAGINDATAIAAGAAHTCAVRPDRVSCWGLNRNGQLGDGTMTTSPTPVDVRDLTDAIEVALGFEHSCARRANGEVLCWGSADSGAIALSGPPRASPERIADVSNAAALTAGHMHTCALRVGGTVSCWGRNQNGELGDGAGGGSTSQSSRPVAVRDLRDAVQVEAVGTALVTAHTCARRSAGQLSCWGNNDCGQLGTGAVTARPLTAPAPVTVVDDVAEVTVGALHTCARRRLTGEVLCWGCNAHGQLGAGPAIRQRAEAAPVPGL
jgi:alpha-tubulin suppressor-like RCC1 family protein